MVGGGWGVVVGIDLMHMMSEGITSLAVKLGSRHFEWQKNRT